MYFVYGQRTISTKKGFFGESVTCSLCGRTYKPSLIKVTKYFHVDYIPLMYLGAKYYASCPVCAGAREMDKQSAKAIIAEGFDTTSQDLSAVEMYDKTNKIRSFIMKDNISGQDICIETNITRGRAKELKRERGLKSVEKVTI